MDRTVKVLPEANAMLGGYWLSEPKTWTIGYTAPWRTLRLYVGLFKVEEAAEFKCTIWGSADGERFFLVGDEVTIILTAECPGLTIERTVGSYTHIRMSNSGLVELVVQAELAN